MAVLPLVTLAGLGYAASSGNQSISIAAASGIDIVVPATAAILPTVPPTCGTASTTVVVSSNKAWNLQIRADPTANPNAKAKNILPPFTEMQSALQYSGGDISAFTNITTTYANLFNTNQGHTSGTNVSVTYQQCVSYLDDPGAYQITVNYLGVQP